MLRKVSLIFITILIFVSSLFSLETYMDSHYDFPFIKVTKKGWYLTGGEFKIVKPYVSTIWTWENNEWKVWVNSHPNFTALKEYVERLGILREFKDDDTFAGWIYVPEDLKTELKPRGGGSIIVPNFVGWKIFTPGPRDFAYINTTTDIVSIWGWDENHWLVYSPVPKIQNLLDKYGVSKLEETYGGQAVWVYRDPSLYCTYGSLDESQLAFKQIMEHLAKTNPALYEYDNGTFSNLKRFICQHIQEFRGLSKDEFIDKIYNMFGFLNDEHLEVGGKRLVSETWEKVRNRKTFDLNITSKYLDGKVKDDNIVTVLYFKDYNILYIRVKEFVFHKYYNVGLYNIYVSARNFINQVDSIIVDFRGNPGGYIYSAFDSFINDQTLLMAFEGMMGFGPVDDIFMNGTCFRTKRFEFHGKTIKESSIRNLIFLVDYKSASTAEIVPVLTRTFYPDHTIIIGTDTSWRNFDLDKYIPEGDIEFDTCINPIPSYRDVSIGAYEVTLANGIKFKNYGAYTRFIKDGKRYNVLWNGVIPDIKLDYNEIKEYMNQGKDLFIEKALEYLEQKGVISLGESSDVLDIDLDLSNIDKYTKTPPVLPVFDNITEYFSE